AAVTSARAGFKRAKRSVSVDQRPRLIDFEMSVSRLTEQVTGEGSADKVEQQTAPSQNVVNLQRKVAGVLPVRVDVPRSGTAYRFVRPLVLDEETRVGFRYRRR